MDTVAKMKRKLLLIFFMILVGGMLFVPMTSMVQAQGGVTTFSSLRVTNFYRAHPRATIVVTNNGTVLATGTNQPISSTAAVGTSGANIPVRPAGTLLILHNVGAQTITFTETGTLVSAGNIILGANDTATLLSNGTNWIQVGASNN